MIHSMKQIFTIALATLLVVSSGCGGNVETDPTYSVSGVVTFGGDAVGDGKITFYDPKTGYSKAVKLSGGTQFSVELIPGNYQVSVTPPPTLVDGGDYTDDEEVVKPTDTIPESAFRPDTSGLTVDVAEADVDGVKFDLKQ